MGSSWISESRVVLFKSRRFPIPTYEEEAPAIGEGLARLIQSELTLLGCGIRHPGIEYDIGVWRFDMIEGERLFKVDLNVHDDEDGDWWQLAFVPMGKKTGFFRRDYVAISEELRGRISDRLGETLECTNMKWV
jgi:hypothetical protein